MNHTPPLTSLGTISIAGERVAQDKGQGHLVERLPRNVGTAIGLELRDSTQALSATNSKPVKAGMAFNVVVGEQGGVEWRPCWATVSWDTAAGKGWLARQSGVLAAWARLQFCTRR